MSDFHSRDFRSQKSPPPSRLRTEPYSLHAEASIREGVFRYQQKSPSAPVNWSQVYASLRTQLMILWVVLVLILVTGLMLIYELGLNQFLVFLGIALLILISLGLAFTITTFLLRPLWRIIDVAQALALGDLQQRKRLLSFLPAQNKVDRLAASLNELALRLQRAEERQLISEKSFKRFFADASHQLRTPLTSIIGFTELMLRGAITDQETTQRVLKRLKSESDRMASLINGLLTLARLNDMQLNTESVDLVSLSSDAIKQVRSQVNDDRTISLTLATQDRFGIQADRERLKQLLFILLDNALKYGRPAPEGSIMLKLERQQQTIVIRVADNGPGIENEDFKHIFDSFYRGREANSSPIVGSGLGLTIASTIVQAHNGTISANSQPGGGTEFKVILPLTPSQI